MNWEKIAKFLDDHYALTVIGSAITGIFLVCYFVPTPSDKAELFQKTHKCVEFTHYDAYKNRPAYDKCTLWMPRDPMKIGVTP